MTYTLDGLRRAAPLFDGTSAAIGNFDGVHRGHAQVLEGAVRRGRQLGVPSVVFTFDPHPRAVVGDGAPPALTTRIQRLAQFQALGATATVTLRFDGDVAALSPEQFVQDALVKGLRVRHVVVGDDFRFGQGARGTARRLAELGLRFGFTVQTVAAAKEGDAVISSSAIREALWRGDVRAAARMLGRPYEIVGAVVRGEGRGKRLGFATANVEPDGGLLLPGPGVYVAWALDRPAAAVVGDKPTFGCGRVGLEVHLLDFDGDLRGRRLSVQFLDKVRDVGKFPSPDRLRAQMADDVTRIRRWFAKDPMPGEMH